MTNSKRVDVDHPLHLRFWWGRRRKTNHFLLHFLALMCHAVTLTPSLGLNTDGAALLSFKYSILYDPLGALTGWNRSDPNPCSWHGVTCGVPGKPDTYDRVVGLSLPSFRLSGSIPSGVAAIRFLRTLDLSNNSLNGTLPRTLFINATDLRFLDLSNNRISGRIPAAVGLLTELQLLNLSDNALSGSLPKNLTTLHNLTVVWLRNNHFTGSLPSRFSYVRVLDLSSNFISGHLPPDFGGDSLNYLNLSYNNLSGEIPSGFASDIPGNATLDLAFNSLAGKIPESTTFLNQEPRSFSGNPSLCGAPTKNPCPIPSSPSSIPKPTDPNSTPAIAAIPRTIGSGSADGRTSSENGRGQSGIRPWTIIGIAVGDLAGVLILTMVFMYVYRFKKRKSNNNVHLSSEKREENSWSSTSLDELPRRSAARWSCLRKTGSQEDSSETSEPDTDVDQRSGGIHGHGGSALNESYKQGKLVSLDGGGGDKRPLELDALLKASAYILGATSSCIMYKAVLEDGTVLAVRRIGESGLERLKDFEGQVRAMARLIHPNLAPVRGFYWGVDEKLIIYDFMPNGSLANARSKKFGSSPCHLPWEARLRIAKGVARGLAYLHEKKHVHGNLKPSNILLGPDFDPKIGDFGLERLVSGETSSKAGGSARNFGSKRSTASRDSFQEATATGPGTGPSPSPSPSSVSGISPYHAPESLRTLKPNPKWDVFSFGVILLELLSGKVMAVDELGQANGVMVDDGFRAVRMADAAIRIDLEGKEDALLACFKLGLGCASPIPQKRPQIKEALQILEQIPCASSCSTSTTYYYG
ncbi:hypothetical protein SAY87_009121 [Trapa incisa]|uniref:Protein kinase domain-containing protein n=1 Tax=Trapa incisa TaxID=236973 RepID=A0AAN7JXR4_9MYRT|nr:hypothetical protein SAY87_009121 [Trapa incisa]